MPYTSLAALTDRFGVDMIVALTDRGMVATGEVDVAVVDRAIADADAVIDGYLAGRYALPLVSTPALIATLAQDITLWKLFQSEPNAKVKADYDAATRALRDIAAGIIRIPEASGIEPATPAANGVQVVDRDRPFSADNMTGFI